MAIHRRDVDWVTPTTVTNTNSASVTDTTAYLPVKVLSKLVNLFTVTFTLIGCFVFVVITLRIINFIIIVNTVSMAKLYTLSMQRVFLNVYI